MVQKVSKLLRAFTEYYCACIDFYLLFETNIEYIWSFFFSVPTSSTNLNITSETVNIYRELFHKLINVNK